MAAQAFFVGALAIAIFKTAAITPGSSIYINVKAHSIAFSALYFWIIPAVFLSAVIGVSQTEKSIPNFLEGMGSKFNHHEFLECIQLPDFHSSKDEHRVHIVSGGIYAWQPKPNTPTTLAKRLMDNFLAIFSVTSSVATACLISWYVPSDGWQPRHCAYATFLLIWTISFLLTNLVKHPASPPQQQATKEHPATKQRNTKLPEKILRFKLTFLKDAIVTICTLAALMYVQVGPFNNCEAYSAFGTKGVALPYIPDTARTLSDRIRGLYPAVAFVSIGFQVMAIVVVLGTERRALRVLLQTDDGTSLWPRWLRWLRWPGWLTLRVPIWVQIWVQRLILVVLREVKACFC
jgi:zinc transporter ZupT